MTDIRGRFLWFENLTRDVQAASGFYASAIGWSAQQAEVGGQPYAMLFNGPAPIAGLHPIPPGAPQPPCWLSYVGTPDIRETTALAESLGAKVHMRLMEIPTVGTISVMQDPQGAMFAAYQPAALPSSLPGEAKAGDFCWHELATTDVEAAMAFYGRLFGWTLQASHDMGHMGVYHLYGLPGLMLGGAYRKPAEMPAPPNWLPYVRVDDLDATLARVRNGSANVLLGPHVVPTGERIAVVADPQGATFALHQLKA
jgi:uncharacterized protein